MVYPFRYKTGKNCDCILITNQKRMLLIGHKKSEVLIKQVKINSIFQAVICNRSIWSTSTENINVLKPKFEILNNLQWSSNFKVTSFYPLNYTNAEILHRQTSIIH